MTGHASCLRDGCCQTGYGATLAHLTLLTFSCIFTSAEEACEAAHAMAGFPAPGGGLAGNSAGSMTLGVGEQKQGAANMARRKYKLKRSGGK